MSRNANLDLVLRRVARRRTMLAECLGLALLLAVALATGAFCLVAQLARHAALVLGGWLELTFVRLAARRGRVAYEFGFGKLERSAQLLLGLLLLAVGLALLAVGPGIAADLAAQGPAALAVAATANAAWLLWAWPHEPRRGAARSLTLLGQALLSVAVLVPDGSLAFAADLAAGLLIALLAVAQGFRIVADSLQDLVDVPGDRAAVEQVVATLCAAGLERREVAALRSREAGRRLFVELSLAVPAEEPPQRLQARLARARAALAKTAPEVDLAVVLRPLS